jgi:N-acetylmuramoyl-L-alanine amidase
MALFSRIKAFVFFLLLGFFSLTGAGHAFEVKAMRFGSHPDRIRLVIATDQVQPFRAYMLSAPTRLVVDMPVFTWRAGQISKPAGLPVRDIRQGLHGPGQSRIVIDLDRPARIHAAQFLPRDGGQDPRLVIDFAFVGEQEFHAHRNQNFGTLKSDIANAPAPLPRPGAKPVPHSQIPAAQRPLIVIDPGHGGADPGAVGANGAYEKNITLAMARDLKRHLESSGRYRVHLTRDKDVFIRLSERVAIARRKQADLFISLHADSINRSGVRGASIYTLSEKASDAETEKLAARENLSDAIAGLDLTHEDEDVANILLNLAMRDTMNQSKFFANTAVGTLKAGGIQMLDNPHRFAGFAVLKAPDIPSVLVELGYMSNAQESGMLLRQDYRDQIAIALMAGIDRYFETLRAQ